ncbi:MAG: hypothetical protein AB7O67_13080 [Vicinamibacterales bacterium]
MPDVALPSRAPVGDEPDLRLLFHRLNNQLGIILAHAELLEAKAADEAGRARASQVVMAALEAMSVTRTIRDRTDQNPG